jgi:hypothetical protein
MDTNKNNPVAFLDEYLATYKPLPKEVVEAVIKACEEKIKAMQQKNQN